MKLIMENWRSYLNEAEGVDAQTSSGAHIYTDPTTGVTSMAGHRSGEKLTPTQKSNMTQNTIDYYVDSIHKLKNDIKKHISDHRDCTDDPDSKAGVAVAAMDRSDCHEYIIRAGKAEKELSAIMTDYKQFMTDIGKKDEAAAIERDIKNAQFKTDIDLSIMDI